MTRDRPHKYFDPYYCQAYKRNGVLCRHQGLHWCDVLLGPESVPGKALLCGTHANLLDRTGELRIKMGSLNHRVKVGSLDYRVKRAPRDSVI